MTADVGREVEAVDLSALDWDVACEHPQHASPGSPAVWALHMRRTRVCGCTGRDLNLSCDPCWVRQRATPLVECAYCRALATPTANVLRVERIRPPSSP